MINPPVIQRLVPERFERAYLDDMCRQIQPVSMALDENRRKVSLQLFLRNQLKYILSVFVTSSNDQVVASK